MNNQNINDTYFLMARSIFDSAIWSGSPDVLKLFIYLIGQARYKKKSKKYPTFEIKRGECLTSLSKIANDNEYIKNNSVKRWSKSTMSRMLHFLEENEYIKIARDTFGTHISICNYETYQNKENYAWDANETAMQQLCNSYENNSNKGNKGNKGKLKEKNNKKESAAPNTSEPKPPVPGGRKKAKRISAVREIPESIAGSVKAIVAAYRKIKSGSGGIADGKIHLANHLQSGISESELMAAVKKYGRDCETLGTEDKYRLQINNFFGKRAEWESYDEDWQPAPPPERINSLGIDESNLSDNEINHLNDFLEEEERRRNELEKIQREKQLQELKLEQEKEENDNEISELPF